MRDMLMKTALCAQSGFARRIDRYLNSVWYPICLGALCAFSGLGDSSRYTVCMGLIAVTVLLTVLFATDMKPLFAPMLMSFCALGKDSTVSYGDQKGDVMLSGHTHIPLCEERDGILCANPGSVSIPKANSPHSYMILTEEGMVWKTLEGDAYQTYSFSSFEV